jgi:hypothetical protein
MPPTAPNYHIADSLETKMKTTHACALVTAFMLSVVAFKLEAFAGDDGAQVANARDLGTQDSTTSRIVSDLQSKVAELQSEIDSLKAQTNRDWLSEKRAEEIRGIVQDVLADADVRSSLLQSGMTAGWDKGFFIGSSDANWRLNIGGQFQVRYVYNIQDESPTDDERGGFELRRAKLVLTGNVVDPSWKFDMQLAADRATGAVVIEDAGWIQKDFGNGWKIWLGQMKAPFLREEVLSSRRLFAIERSLVNSFFTAGTVQGVMVGWESDNIHLYGMFHDGNRSLNSAWSVEDTEYAFSGRVEFLALGEWKNMQDYNSFKDEGAGVVIGGAVNYQKSEFGTGNNLPSPDFNNAEVANLGLTADVTIDFGGASLAGAVLYRNLDTDATGASLDQWGFHVRGGVFVVDDWEIYGQYEWATLDVNGLEDLSVVTVGVTKYWAKHNLKWQNDVGYGINSVAAPFAVDSAGWRADAPGQDGQIVLRSQFQLLF